MSRISRPCALLIFFILPSLVEAQKRCVLSAKISPLKPTYIYGEPVGLRLTVSNSGPATGFSTNYPGFWLPDRPGIVLVDERGAPRQTSDADLQKAQGDTHFTSRGEVIEAGASFSVDVYVQRFLVQPSLGEHHVKYQMNLPCGANVPPEQGEFRFSVIPGTPQQLREIILRYTNRLEPVSGWGFRAAEEALMLIESPDVIPSLSKMISLGRSQEGLRALKKFPHNIEAEKVVLAAIRSGDPDQQSNALSVLSLWKYLLPPNDPDPGVAGEARRAAESLRSKKQ